MNKKYGLLLCFLSFILSINGQSNKIGVLEGNKIVLKNNAVTLEFADTDKFSFKSFSSAENKLSWLPTNGDFDDLWHIELKNDRGVNPIFKPSNTIYKGAVLDQNTADKAIAIFTWHIRLSKLHYCPLRVIVTLEKESGLSDWRLEVDLPKNWQVTKTDFPRLTLQKGEQAKLIMPAGWGVEYDLNGHSNYEAEYPSCTGSMQLLSLYNMNQEAFYLATHDKYACIKTFDVEEKGQFANVSTKVVASEAWTQDGTFKMPFSFSLGIEPKGWETAVTNWYRPFTFETVWGNKTFESRKLPQWVLNADMWLRPHFTTDETLSTLKEGLNFFGADAACHWYRWHQIEYDVDYPEYFPAKENFVDQMKVAQKLGSHVIPYINGRLWDPQSASYQVNDAIRLSCRKEDGTLYTEIYGSMVPNSVTCPSSLVWQETIQDLAYRLQYELGSNGVYIDQIGAAQGVPCWNKDHSHPVGGGEFWHQSYRNMLENIRRDLPADNILITEENSECFMDLFDLMLMVNTPQYTKTVPLYPLIYSDRMMLNCFLYYPIDEKVNSLSFRFKNVMGLLWGTQLGWIKPELIMAPEAKEEALFLKSLVQFRKHQHDLIYGGRFLNEVIPEGDNPIIPIPNMYSTPAVRGAKWRSKTGKEAILLINMDNDQHTVLLSNGRSLTMNGKTCVRINLN